MNYFLEVAIFECTFTLCTKAMPHRREAIGKPRNLNFQECLFV